MAKKPTRKPPPKDPENKNDITPDEVEYDQFAYFFNEYNPETEVVTLSRLTPDIWQGVSLKGYICDITPGHREPWIKDNFGGGSYRLIKRDLTSGRILGSTQINVSGNPKVGSTSMPLDSAIDSGNDYNSELEGLRVNVGGTEIPYSSNFEELQKFIVFVKSLETAFPQKVDINTELLKLLLTRQEPANPLNSIAQIKEAAELFNPTEKGGNIYDVITEGIKNAGSILSGVASLPKLRAPIKQPIRQLPGKASGVISEKEPAKGLEIAGNIEQNNESLNDKKPGEQAESEVKPMGEREIVLAVANQMVKSFRLIPALDAPQVVQMLDLLLQQSDKIIRAALVSKYSDVIINLCATELEVDWNDPETKIGNREKFQEWSQEIFTMYGDPEREVMT